MEIGQYVSDLSIIIVSWNSQAVIGPCLDSVYRFTKDLDFEVILVDNGSTDGTLDRVRPKYPQVRVIENKYNVGFSTANNQGISASTSKCVILLNPDTELIENSLKCLYDFLNSSDDIGACGCTLVYPDRSPQWSFGYYPSFPRMLWITMSGLLGVRYGRKPHAVIPERIYAPIRVEYINGADLMMKRSVLDNVGLLDERFFAYFEEVDLCRRITQAGYEIWYQPNSSIVHNIGETFSEWKAGIYYTSLFRYLHKHCGRHGIAKYYLLAKHLVHLLLSSRGGPAYQENLFRYRVIHSCGLVYPSNVKDTRREETL